MHEAYLEELRERIIAHCKWISVFDREYAIRAFKQYENMMPWLKLRGN